MPLSQQPAVVKIPFFHSHNMSAAKDHPIVLSNLFCRNLTDKLDGKDQSDNDNFEEEKTPIV